MKKDDEARLLLVSGWKGISAVGHFERLVAVLTDPRSDEDELDRTMEDLRRLAYGNGVAAAQLFRFIDREFVNSDAALSKAQDDLDALSDDVPFLRILSAFCADVESLAASAFKGGGIFARRSAGARASGVASTILVELRQAFQSGRDEVRDGHAHGLCPVFAGSSAQPPATQGT